MPVLVSARICEREFDGQLTAEVRKSLIRTARKDLAISIAGAGLPPRTRLLKCSTTTEQGARRVIYLYHVSNDDYALLFYRDKKDAVGQNASMKNPEFCRELSKALTIIKEDFAAGKYETIDIPGPR